MALAKLGYPIAHVTGRECAGFFTMLKEPVIKMRVIVGKLLGCVLFSGESRNRVVMKFVMSCWKSTEGIS